MRSLATTFALRRILQSCRVVDDPALGKLLEECRRETRVWQRATLLVTSAPVAPALVGVIHPRIILSESSLAALSREELRWLFRHEYVHIRRWDLSIQRLWRVARAVHWFNPLVWWWYSRAQLETELACDESVLRVRTEVSGYGCTLLKVAELLLISKRVPAGVALLTRGPNLARRIDMIANYRPHSWLNRLLAFVCLMGLAGAGLTGAVEEVSPQTAPATTAAVQPQEPPTAVPANTAAKDGDQVRTMIISIVDGADKPLAGAKIRIGLWTKAPPKPVGDHVTDAKGQVKVELPQSFELLRIWATKDGHVPMFGQWWPRFQQDGHKLPAEYQFRLEKGTVIGGFLKNEEGKPVVGAKVEVQVVLPPNPRQPMTRLSISSNLSEGATACTTDARGYWTLNNVPDDDSLNIQVKTSHPDYLADQAWGAAQLAHEITNASLRKKTSTIVMRRGVSLHGTVTDPTGAPVVGAVVVGAVVVGAVVVGAVVVGAVVVGAVVVHGDDPYLQPGTQGVHTDARGVFRLPRLAPGPTQVTVLAKNWAPHTVSFDLDRDKDSIDFQLKRGRTLRIRFVDSAGKPIPKVYIGIAKWRGRNAFHNQRNPGVLDTKIPRQADERGIYEWKWAPDDAIEFWFEQAEFLDVRNVTLVAGDLHEVKMERPVVVTGKVTDAATGKPIPFFKIRPAVGPIIPRLGSETQAGKNGEYRVTIGRRSPAFFIAIEAEGYESAESDPFPGSEEGAFQFNCKLKKRKE